MPTGLHEFEFEFEFEVASGGNEDCILDVPFTAEEVEQAVLTLKKKKAAGPDGLTAKHLQEAVFKYG